MGRRIDSADGRARVPGFEPLEGRLLLTATSSAQAARVNAVRREYHDYVGQLRDVELRSRATPAEYLALRDDSREIAAAASASTLPAATVAAKAAAASLEIDRSAVRGWLGDRGRAEVAGLLARDLDGLGVPPELVARTLADMRALAESAGVTEPVAHALAEAAADLQAGEDGLPAGSPHFDGPTLYYGQHLRGFFRGLTAAKVADKARLRADLRASGPGDPAGAAALAAEAGLLVSLDAQVTSGRGRVLGDAFLAAFDGGPPTAASLAGLRASIGSVLGGPGSAARSAAIGRVAAEAPAAFRGAGSTAALGMVVADALAVADDGGDATVNPFRIVVLR